MNETNSLTFDNNFELLPIDDASVKHGGNPLESLSQKDNTTLQNPITLIANNYTPVTNALPLQIDTEEPNKDLTSQPLLYNLVAAQNSVYDITSLINSISSESKVPSEILLCSNSLESENLDQDIPSTYRSVSPDNANCSNAATSNKYESDNWNDVLQITVNSNGEIEVTNIGSVSSENLEVGSNEETSTSLENDSHLRYVNKDSQTSGNSYKCMVYNCYKNLSSYKEMVEHRKTHQQEKVFGCTYENCPWSFMTQYKLNRHMQSHKREKKFLCPYAKCNRVFSTNYNLKVHAKAHGENKEECKCKYCDKQFVDKRNLGNHMRKVHDVEPTFSCTFPDCNKKLHTLAALKLHMKMHINGRPKVTECPFEGCGRKFAKNCQLKEHIYSHTGERPFKCNDCEWSFTTSGLLKRHKQIHSVHKMFICPIDKCKREFSRALRFKKHLKIHETDDTATGLLVQSTLTTMDRDHLFYICPYEECGSLFKSLKGAQQHMRQLHDAINISEKTEKIKANVQSEDLSDHQKVVLVGNANDIAKPVNLANTFITTVSENGVDNPEDCMDQIFLDPPVDLSSVDLTYNNVDPAEFFNGMPDSQSNVPCSISSSLKVSNLDCGTTTSLADVYFNLNECTSTVDPNVVMSLNKQESSNDSINKNNSFEKCARTDITFHKLVETEISETSVASVPKESTINLNDIT